MYVMKVLTSLRKLQYRKPFILIRLLIAFQHLKSRAMLFSLGILNESTSRSAKHSVGCHNKTLEIADVSVGGKLSLKDIKAA